MRKKFFGFAILASLVVALFPAVAAPANATGDYNFLMFSKSGITDPNPNQEDLTMKAALEEIGTVTLFDGGDGTASAWTTALTGMNAIVFPEGNVYNNGAAMLPEAATVVKNWISAGGRAVGTGSYTHTNFIEYLTGIDRTTWCNRSLEASGDVWTLAVASDTLPATILTGDYTGGICDWNLWSAAEKVGTTVIYGNDAQNNMGIVQFAVGTGTFTYYAFDWYPNSGETLTVLPQWNEALRLGAAGTFEEAAGGGGDSAPAFTLELELALSVGDTVAGGPVTVSASGLQPDSAWNLVLRSTPQTIDLGTVGADGLILSEVTIPAGLEPGWHSLTLTGTGADGIAYMRVARFFIAEDGTLGEPVIYEDVIEAALVNTGLTYAIIAGETLLVLLFAFAAWMAFGAKSRLRFAAMDERLAVMNRKLNRLYGSSRNSR
ncbi:unannotated protein [freshwater metagenome]|uniref:Unannotated protein n=1 Tax=freshwater metagenome TaxID=449393 RepID=A0A6J6DBG1_9ZZZZ|nr:hypothetical protein [Actinomycetota bacterium]